MAAVHWGEAFLLQVKHTLMLAAAQAIQVTAVASTASSRALMANWKFHLPCNQDSFAKSCAFSFDTL